MRFPFLRFEPEIKGVARFSAGIDAVSAIGALQPVDSVQVPGVQVQGAGFPAWRLGLCGNTLFFIETHLEHERVASPCQGDKNGLGADPAAPQPSAESKFEEQNSQQYPGGPEKIVGTKPKKTAVAVCTTLRRKWIGMVL
jgi:hypothetical protein